MGMMGNERGRRGRQTERHSQGGKTRGIIERGAYIERGRHKVELELFFFRERTKRGPRELQRGCRRERASGVKKGGC